MDREAKIKLIAEGASRAQAETNRTADAVGNIGTKAGLASGALQELGRVAFRIASDAARAFNDVRPIEFGKAGDQARQFSDQIARYAQRFGVDAGAMRSQFMQVGESIGATSDRVAGFARSLSEVTSVDASAAIRELGEYANETGRELEDMAGIGAVLMAKLGIPAEKIGESLRTIRDTARDFSTIGGSVALEKTIMGAAPDMMRFQGGFAKQAAVVAALTKGMSPDVAQETARDYFASFTNKDPAEMTRKVRQLLGDPNYQPLAPDPLTGRMQIKEEVPALLLPAMRRAARPALYNFFGGGLRGVSVAERVLRMDLKGIKSYASQVKEQQRELGSIAAEGTTQELLEGAGQGIDLRKMSPSQIENFKRRIQDEYKAAPGASDAEQIRLQRARVDAERQNVELGIGETVQEQRDKRNALYQEHRTAQAGVDTVKHYMGGTVGRIADIAEAVGVQAITAVQKPQVVELGPNSISGIGRAVSKSAPTPPSTSAKAVEDSKAKNRGGANY